MIAISKWLYLANFYWIFNVFYLFSFKESVIILRIFILKSSKEVKVSVTHLVMLKSLWPHGLQPARLLCVWDSPGKNTGVGCHFLLQGIFLTQGSSPRLLHCRQIPHCLSHQRSPSKNGKFFKIYWAVFKRNFWQRFTGNNLNKQENNYNYWDLQK